MKIKLLLFVGIYGITHWLQGSLQNSLLAPKPVRHENMNPNPILAAIVSRDEHCLTPKCGTDRQGCLTPKCGPAPLRRASSQGYGSNSELADLLKMHSSPSTSLRKCCLTPSTPKGK